MFVSLQILFVCSLGNKFKGAQGLLLTMHFEIAPLAGSEDPMGCWGYNQDPVELAACKANNPCTIVLAKHC